MELVFAGAGLRGYAYFGSLYELFGDDLRRTKSVIGTSFGAVVSVACAMHTSPMRAMEVADQVIPDNLLTFDIKNLFMKKGLTLKSHMCKYLREMMERLVGGSSRWTLEQLEAYRGVRVQIVTTDLHSMMEVVVPKHWNVVDAMYASMALPLAMEPIEMDGQTFVDGGVVNNFPMNLATMDEVYGFCVDESLVVPRHERMGHLTFFTRMLFMMMFRHGHLIWEALSPEQKTRVIICRVPEMPFISSVMTSRQRWDVFVRGKMGVRIWQTLTGPPSAHYQTHLWDLGRLDRRYDAMVQLGMLVYALVFGTLQHGQGAGDAFQEPHTADVVGRRRSIEAID